MEDWTEIRRLRRAEGMAIQAIARRLRMCRNTVKKALAGDEPPRHRRAAKGSIVDPVAPSPQDFNTQLVDWLAQANARHHRSLGCRPANRFDADRAAMVALPPAPPAVGWRLSTRLPRDHYVRVAGNDYSVHPSVVGRRVDVVADLEQVQAFCDGREVARHARCWAKHQTITDPAHRQAAATLRAVAHRPPTPAVDAQVHRRDLTDYDRLFGLDVDPAVA